MNIITRIIALLLLIAAYLQGFSQVTLEDIFLKGKYYPKAIDDLSFLHQADQYAVLLNAAKGQQIVFYDPAVKAVDSLPVEKYKMAGIVMQSWYESAEVSNTDQYYLLKADEEKLFRRAGAANYFIANAKGNVIRIGGGKISFPKFSWDDTRVAYVKYNNLYWCDPVNGTEHAITTDGAWNLVINGKSDWVYEEELELTRAFFWNPQSDKIAYLKFDESNVREYLMPKYYGQTYPANFSYKYPLVGEENSKVTVWLYDIKKNKNIPVNLSGHAYEYIPRMGWNATGNEIWVMLLNRHQDSLKVLGYDINTKKIRTIYEDHSDTYLDVPSVLYFLNDNSFIVNSDRGGYKHLYHFDVNGKPLKELTPGNFEVTAFYGVDQKNKTIYYQSNEGYTAGRKVWSVNYETLEKKLIAGENGTNTVVFAPGYRYFFRSNTSAASPYTIKIISNGQKDSVLTEDNSALRNKFSSLPQKEFIKIPVNGVELEAWIIKPDSFDVNKKYPLLMNVYGGPGNQEVLDKWGSTNDVWFSYLAQQGYVIACVDNRGSSGKGVAFEKSIYLNLGKLEIADQVAAAKYFADQSYIDSSRIGIYGSSYGGYMAAMCLMEGNDIFKTAIAQAPVSDWKLYDNVYTERYMRTPEENPKGYDAYIPVNSAHKLKGNLLIIHGTADDNVHFQHAIELINALNDAHKTYGLYIYPDRKHGISGGENRYDLYYKITQYLLEKL